MEYTTLSALCEETRRADSPLLIPETTTRSHTGPRKNGVCLALQLAEDEFYILANACAFSLFPTAQGNLI